MRQGPGLPGVGGTPAARSVPHVVFPTATDQREHGRIDVYYGAGDEAIAVARLTVPEQLPQSK